MPTTGEISPTPPLSQPSSSLSLLHHLPMGVLLLGAEAEILFCNAHGAQILCRSEEELLATRAFDSSWQVVQADGTPLNNMRILLEHQENLILGVSVPEKGEKIWLLVSTQPHNVQGNVRQVICTFSDITERRNAEIALIASQNSLEQQNKVLLALTKSKTLTQSNFQTAIREITEAAAKTLNIERVSVWLYNSERSKIHCLNLYEQTPARHTSGAELAAVEYPAYFQALETERTIAASDAYTDPRTREFACEYLPATGVKSMLDASIWLKGETIGVVCHEQTGTKRHWTLEEQNFAGCIADLVSLAMEANERQLAQEAYRQSEAKFQKLVANVPGMIYQFVKCPNGSTSFPYVSSACREIFELEPEQVQNKAETLLALIHPDDRPSFQESVAISADTLQPWKWEGRFITPSGKHKWLSCASRPEKLQNGDILWDGLVLDLTERQQIEAAIAKRERYLATLVEAQRCLLGDDTHGVCYPQILELLGQASGSSRVYLFENYRDSQGFLWTKQCAEWCTPEITSRINNPVFQDFPFQKQFPEWSSILAQGYTIFASVDELGEVVQQFFACGNVLAILILPLIVNNQFWGWIGFDNCVDAHPWEPVEVDLLAAAAAAVALHQERALAEKALSQAKEELEIRVEQRTQALKQANQQLMLEISERTAAQRAQAQLYSQAQAVAQIAQARSQELQQALEKLQNTQAQLIQSEKMSSLGQLVAGVAHEINNPVSFISGNLVHANQYIKDLLDILRLYQEFYPQPMLPIVERSQEIDLDFLVADLPKLLASMQVGAQRISQIVFSLRNFSRLDESEMKSVNLHEGIDNTLLILQHRFKPNGRHPGIQVIKEYGNLPLVECYPGRLNQVFMNILSNAIDVLEKKVNEWGNQETGEEICPSPCIWIRTEVLASKRVCVRIIDNGLGMSENVKARIFDPFFTTKPVGSGTGLGLSISYQIVVENHKGVLYCQSETGQGTEFCVEIPICQSQGCV